MDDPSAFLRGLGFGFAIAAPVGPIGVICIRRTLLHGMPSGFLAGLGAALADMVYGAIAAMGLVGVMQALGAIRPAVELGGAVFLFYLGWRIWTARPAVSGGGPEAVSGGGAGHLFRGFGQVFLLTLANPATILSFLGIFAALGLPAGAEVGGALALVAGVGLGSAAWWLALSAGVGLFRARIGPRALLAINRLSAISLTAFAVWSLAGFLGR